MFPAGFLTSRMVLRPVAPEDAGGIFDNYAQDPQVTRFLTWRPHRSRSETEAYVARCIAAPADMARTYVLVDRGTDKVRGAFDVRLADRHRVEVGYVLARECWSHGMMTEALTAVVAWALARAAIVRIGAYCDVENIGSARVMEKAGLTREGVLRRWLVHPNTGDEPRDCFSYARVR